MLKHLGYFLIAYTYFVSLICVSAGKTTSSKAPKNAVGRIGGEGGGKGRLPEGSRYINDKNVNGPRRFFFFANKH